MAVTYTTATVIAVNNDRGIAYDYLNNPVHFTKTDVPKEDWAGIRAGVRVLIGPGNTVELATASFNRWEEANVA